MRKLLFLLLLIFFSNTAKALEDKDLYNYAYRWGGLSASCYGFHILKIPKYYSKELFKVHYEGAKKYQNKEIYRLITSNMYDKDGPMYETCRELYPE